jgi:hypothetical protein
MNTKICTGIVCMLFCSGGSLAAEDKIHLNAGLHTDLPLSLGGRIGVELPGRIRIASSLGFLPDAYAKTLNTFLVGENMYNQATGDLVRSALKNSLVWRLHAGFRPFENYGFHMEAGYGLIALGSSATATEIVAGTSGYPLSAGDSGKSVSVNSTLLMLDVELGWEWFWDQIYFRVSLGGAFTLFASTWVKANYQPTLPRLTQAFTGSTENYLDNIYQSYVHTPTASFTVGYSFF